MTTYSPTDALELECGHLIVTGKPGEMSDQLTCGQCFTKQAIKCLVWSRKSARKVDPFPELTTLKDMYGHRLHVKASDLASGKTMLRLYHPRTGLPRSTDLGDDLGTIMLHRSNICQHDRRQFVAVTLFGETHKECPTCRAAVEAAWAELRKQAQPATED